MARSSALAFDRHTKSGRSLWKRQNSGQRTKKLLRLFVLLVLLLATVNVVVKIPGWVSNINRPFEEIHSSIASRGEINSDFSTNILLISISSKNNLQDLALASFNSTRTSLTIVSIPIATKTYTSGDKFDISLAAIYFAKPYFDSDFDSLYVGVKEALALPIDGYFVFIQDDLVFSEETILDTKNRVFTLLFYPRILSIKSWLNNHMKTNYSVTSIWSLARSFKNVSKEKLHLLDLEEVVSEKRLVFSEVDKFVRDNILDNSISNEQALVEIEGEFFTNQIGRVINNLGGSTINPSSGEEESSETKVLFSTDKNKIAKRLGKYLGVEVEKKDIESGVDVRVVVGKDFLEKFYGE